jgi:hypothetical protein
VDWTFGTVLWSTLVFFFWFTVIWMFIAVFADIFRRDISGWAKAGWITLIVILPFIGLLAYFIARPTVTEADLRGGGMYGATYGYRPSPTEEIAKATELYEKGKITAVEYEQLKRIALAA